jgi:hypothetical protein
MTCDTSNDGSGPAVSLDASSNKIMTTATPKTIKFWAQDPNALIQAPYDFFPMPEMTLEQKLNALTRAILVVTALSFAYSRNTRLLVICVILLLSIFLFHWAYKRQEGFLLSQRDALDRIKSFRDNEDGVFQAGTAVNPLSNVLVSDWVDNPQKRPAPPSEKNSENILLQAKRMVVQNNPGQPDIAEKLFADLANDFEFEQSMRPFFSTAASTIPNDQGAFAEFCYGSMVSCKEGNLFACARDNPQYRNQ